MSLFITKLVTDFKSWFKQAARRTWNAFWVAFFGQMTGASLIGVNGALDLSIAKRLLLSGLSAGGMGAWSVLSKFRGDPGSAYMAAPTSTTVPSQ